MSPLRLRILEEALPGLSARECPAFPTAVFFWLEPRRLEQFLAARAAGAARMTW